LKDARAIAEEFGSTADLAVVEIAHGRNKGKIVAVFKRSPDGDGMTWYRSVPPWLT
jgi:DNA-directed RNA polymerase subunit H (RpoH/RPB5)